MLLAQKIFISLLIITSSVDSAHILGIFPTPSYSHQQPYQTIMKALAFREHTVTVISPNPLKVPVTNYEDIDLSFSYEYWNNITPGYDYYYTTKLGLGEWILKVSEVLCQLQLGSHEIQSFMRKQNNTYDVVIIEMVSFQCYYGLLHYIGSPPVIGIVSTTSLFTTFLSVGNPINPSYVPHTVSSFTNEMTFLQRIYNTAYYLIEYDFIKRKLYEKQNHIIRKFFNETTHTVEEIERNVSIILVNSYWSCDYPIPLVPGIIEIGGVHVSRSPRPLPEDLKDFADNAKKGFIYVSLGSNVRSDKMPVKQRQDMLKVFSNLPYKVLWKWESETIKSKSDNIKLVKWVPQQDVLAHRNLKVFITQGGIQSINEATYHGVPMLIIPVYGDQKHNAAKIASVGAGITLKFEDINSENFNEALENILHNKSYTENAKKFSKLCNDRPEHPLDRAVWWIEYVIRYNGAKHIRSSALDLSWYQIMLLDVFAVMIIISLLVLFIVLCTIKFVYKIYINKLQKELKFKIT